MSSSSHPTSQASRRPLTTPIQPGQHMFDPRIPQIDESFSDLQNLIDPSLTPMDPVMRGPMGWETYHAPLRQYSKEAGSFLLPEQQTPYFQDPYVSWQSGIEPASLVSFGRHESPFSQHPSFSSGESLSPPTESDALPRTPPDTSAASPFQQSYGYHDSWESRHSHILFTGMGHAHESLSVNPHDVNPSQATAEGSVALSRSSSFGPEIHLELHDQQPFEPFEHDENSRAQVKREIQVFTPSAESSYPELDRDADAEPEPSNDDKNDGDYTPRSTRKRAYGVDTRAPTAAARSSGRNGRKRQKLENGMPPASTTQARAAQPAAGTGHVCATCQSSFRDEASLLKHHKAKHLRPFTCVFHFAGCPSSFPNKNEWKRHVMTQHLALTYWLCTQGTCGKCANPAPQPRHSGLAPAGGAQSSPASLPNGAIFNRKDLYTQHVRRMHVPPAVTKAIRSKKPVSEWDEKMRGLQLEAEQTRCQLPTYMKCPSPTCTEEFRGASAWDDRMEHVAKHLDKACEGLEPPLSFGGDGDATLTAWAESPEVGVVRKIGEGKWELVNMLRGVIGPSNGNGKGARVVAAAPIKRRAAPEQEEEDDADGEVDEALI